MTEGRGKYPVIFEPLQNIQASRSTYKVTSFVDFEPYLQYFENFETYLGAFKRNLEKLQDDPLTKEYIRRAHEATTGGTGHPCENHARCRMGTLTYKPMDPRWQALAYKQLRDQCLTRHMHACLTLKQYEYIKNITALIDDSYQRVKAKFLQAIDYVADSGLEVPQEPNTEERKKRSINTSQLDHLPLEDLRYLKNQLTALAAWSTPP